MALSSQILSVLQTHYVLPPLHGLVGLKINPQMAALLGEVVEPLTHVDSVPEVEHQKSVFIQPFLF